MRQRRVLPTEFPTEFLADLPAIHLANLVKFARLQVDFIHIPVRPFQNLWVHHPEPERGNSGKPITSRISTWQARQGRKISQNLIRALRIGMVIGMALKVERQQVGTDVIGVP